MKSQALTTQINKLKCNCLSVNDLGVVVKSYWQVKNVLQVV